MKNNSKKKKVRVIFLGGPVDGGERWFAADGIVAYIELVLGEREYIYKHLPSKGKPSVQKYVFMGHEAVLPPGVEEA